MSYFNAKTTTIFIYSLSVTISAFILNNTVDLLILAIPPLIIATWRAGLRIKWIIAAYSASLIGVFVNSILVVNVGESIVDLGFIVVKKGAIDAFTLVSIKLFTIASAGAFFIFHRDVLEIYRSFLYEMGLPTVISLPIAYSLRILPVARRDLEEILFQRKQRGRRTIWIHPLHLSSIARSLLVVNIERAIWSGISAETRGLSRLRPRFNYKPGLGDVFLYALTSTQYLLVAVL